LESFADDGEVGNTGDLTTIFQDHRQGKRDTGRKNSNL
jgi:hypothetical protein